MIDKKEIDLILARLSNNIDKLNNKKKFTYISSEIIDEFVDIHIDLSKLSKQETDIKYVEIWLI